MNDVVAVMTEVVVTVVAVLVLLIDTALPRRAERGWLSLFVVAGLVIALVSGPLVTTAGTAFNGFVQIDTFTTFCRAVFIVLAIFGAVVAPGYLARRGIPAGEYYATILFSTVGAMTIALSNDLITLFVGIELMSIPIYVLAGMQRRSEERRVGKECRSGWSLYILKK